MVCTHIKSGSLPFGASGLCSQPLKRLSRLCERIISCLESFGVLQGLTWKDSLQMQASDLLAPVERLASSPRARLHMDVCRSNLDDVVFNLNVEDCPSLLQQFRSRSHYLRLVNLVRSIRNWNDSSNSLRNRETRKPCLLALKTDTLLGWHSADCYAFSTIVASREVLRVCSSRF